MANMGPIMILIHKSYNLIKDPERWTQKIYQRDENGECCPWRQGYSFCALGAVNFFASSDESNKGYHGAVCILQRHAEKIFNKQNIQKINDAYPADIAHQNVLKIFESIIEKFVDREPSKEEYLEGLYE